MKKLIAWILTVLMLFSVSACGSAPAEEGTVSNPQQSSSSAEAEPEEDADSDPEQGNDSTEPEEDSSEAESSAYTLNGMTFVIPASADYSELEAGVSAQVELEPAMRRISIVASDLSSFDSESWDMLNELMIARWLGNFEVSGQENYTTTVAGETAQGATATISTEDLTLQCVLTALIHEGTQYLLVYLESPAASGDSTEYFDVLNSITFDA